VAKQSTLVLLQFVDPDVLSEGKSTDQLQEG
jgi:hypothetical protein